LGRKRGSKRKQHHPPDGDGPIDAPEVGLVEQNKSNPEQAHANNTPIPSPTPAPKDKEEGANGRVALWTAVQALATAAGVVVSLWVLWLIYRQVNTGTAALEFNRLTIENEWRATVTVIGVSNVELVVDREIPIRVRFTDKGKGDAQMFRCRTVADIDSKVAALDLADGRLGFIGEATMYDAVTILAGKSQESTPTIGPFSKERIDAVVSGKEVLYIHGVALYSDPFCLQHELRYCFQFDRNGNNPQPCEHWNYSVEPCAKRPWKD